MKIRVYYDNIKARIKESKKKVKFIEKVIRKENYVPGDLNFIFTDDDTLLEINRKFLNHNYYTDVIAFDYSYKKEVNGEIYISRDTVLKNAVNYNVSLDDEILRVMLHGTLHLCGYDDKSKAQKQQMRKKENMLINEYKSK